MGRIPFKFVKRGLSNSKRTEHGRDGEKHVAQALDSDAFTILSSIKH